MARRLTTDGTVPLKEYSHRSHDIFSTFFRENFCNGFILGKTVDRNEVPERGAVFPRLGRLTIAEVSPCFSRIFVAFFVISPADESAGEIYRNVYLLITAQMVAGWTSIKALLPNVSRDSRHFNDH